MGYDGQAREHKELGRVHMPKVKNGIGYTSACTSDTVTLFTPEIDMHRGWNRKNRTIALLLQLQGIK